MHFENTELDGIADTLSCPPSAREAADMPAAFPGTELADLHSFKLATSSGEEELKKEAKRALRNSIFDSALVDVKERVWNN